VATLDEAALLIDLLDMTLTSRQVADLHPVSKSTVNARRAALKTEPKVAAAAQPEAEKLTGKANVNPGVGGDFEDVQTEKPITDWAEIFTRFNIDPELYAIVDNTVRVSMWQQSKRLENGNRDTVDLYSYRARFTRRTNSRITEADFEASRKRVQAWKLPQRIPGTGLGAPVAAVLNLADIQRGKSEGGGIEATEQRLYDGLENFQRYVERQRHGGRNINELVIVNNGDPYEGIGGNYAGQTFQVQQNLRRQQNGVLDIWEAYSRELYPQFDKGQFVSVLCNHTENARMGTNKNQTDDSDSGGAFLAESLQRILKGRAEFDHVTFTIPQAEMNVYADIAGIPVGFNHGHKIPGSDAAGFEKWLNGQVRGDAMAYAVKIWITAHRHHWASWDVRVGNRVMPGERCEKASACTVRMPGCAVLACDSERWCWTGDCANGWHQASSRNCSRLARNALARLSVLGHSDFAASHSST